MQPEASNRTCDVSLTNNGVSPRVQTLSTYRNGLDMRLINLGYLTNVTLPVQMISIKLLLDSHGRQCSSYPFTLRLTRNIDVSGDQEHCTVGCCLCREQLGSQVSAAAAGCRFTQLISRGSTRTSAFKATCRSLAAASVCTLVIGCGSC